MGLCSLVATPVTEESSMVTITLSKEDYRAITALIDKELKMYESQLPHFASKLILVKALTRCLKKDGSSQRSEGEMDKQQAMI